MPHRLRNIALWLAVFVISLSLDRPVAQAVRDHGWDQKATWTKETHRLADTLKAPGEFKWTVVVAAAVLFLSVERFWSAGLVLGAGAISGLNSIIKWIVGRRRPVVGVRPFDLDAFVGGLSGLAGSEKNLSFPSGHAALAFAVAEALAILWPRGRLFFYAIAAVTGIERICENAHYVSDVIVGAAVGVLSAHLMRRILQKLGSTRAKPGPVDILTKAQ